MILRDVDDDATDTVGDDHANNVDDDDSDNVKTTVVGRLAGDGNGLQSGGRAAAEHHSHRTWLRAGQTPRAEGDDAAARHRRGDQPHLQPSTWSTPSPAR